MEYHCAIIRVAGGWPDNVSSDATPFLAVFGAVGARGLHQRQGK